MSRLIVYCRAVPYKRNEINENCCEMHSFNENAFNVLLERSPQGDFNTNFILCIIFAVFCLFIVKTYLAKVNYV